MSTKIQQRFPLIRRIKNGFNGNKVLESPVVSTTTDAGDQDTNSPVWWLPFGFLEIIKESSFLNPIHNPCGGGVEYLHRDPASVGGDEKGSLESETVKYGHESYGTRTRE
jgi:hypothetical protein